MRPTGTTPTAALKILMVLGLGVYTFLIWETLFDPATCPHDRPFRRSCKPWLVASSRQGWQSTSGPWTLCPIQLHPTVRPLLLLLGTKGTGHTVWAPSLLSSLPLAANSGEHTQARNHHSTKRGHFSHAAIMHACMDQSWKHFSIATACRIDGARNSSHRQ